MSLPIQSRTTSVSVAANDGRVPEKLQNPKEMSALGQTAGHALQRSEENRSALALEQELRMREAVTGSSVLAQRLRIEMRAATQVGRMCGLPSSRLQLDTLLGTDQTTSYDDYLHPVEFAENAGDSRSPFN